MVLTPSDLGVPGSCPLPPLDSPAVLEETAEGRKELEEIRRVCFPEG